VSFHLVFVYRGAKIRFCYITAKDPAKLSAIFFMQANSGTFLLKQCCIFVPMHNLESDKEWFASWFESPYYALLYTTREEREAAFFLDNLLAACPIQKGAKILDLPCGKGRHSIYLHKKGYNVTGADLSRRSIAFAKQFEKDGLHFFIHDM